MAFSIDPDIRKASTPPSRFYTDPEVFELCKERVLAKSWQFVCESDRVKVPGQTMPFTFLEGSLNEPLVLVRDLDDRLRCLSNVCTHRGNLVAEGPGVERHLRCRYHGRRFGLDGKFQHMPEFEECEGFPSPKDDLSESPLADWNDLLFASLAAEVPLEEWLRPMADRVGWLPIREFAFDASRSRDYLVQAHWALYVDNYLEAFHIPFIHAGLAETLDYAQYRTELFRYCSLQLGIARGAEDVFDLPESSPDFGRQVSAYYWWVFPNLMFNFYPWGLSINVVKPLGTSETRVSFSSYVWKKELLGRGAGGELDRVEREDEAVVETTQRGLRSRFYDRGRYSPTRETGTHHFHLLLAEFVGKPDVPPS